MSPQTTILPIYPSLTDTGTLTTGVIHGEAVDSVEPSGRIGITITTTQEKDILVMVTTANVALVINPAVAEPMKFS